ncbi:MAG TPA: DUF3267 domain-containing protein [Thermoanaerobaculia bacterium]|nr:DUF3267 domain-containing protein [Thermoanaerobaculia bacterium]
MGRSETPSIEELRGPAFELLDEFRHDDVVSFVARWFFDRPSWITRLNLALSLAALAAVFVTAGLLRVPFLQALAQFGLGVIVMAVVVLPLHEALHAAAYRMTGARRIRWRILWKYVAAYVVAERFVAGARAFFFVALVPFVVITPALIALAVAFPRWGVLWLTVLLLHTAGVSGDWALMNYYWTHRGREIFTFDEAGQAYFYVRKR